MTGEHVATIEAIRARARQHIERGAVADGYRAPLPTVIRLLNEALATELVCVLRYERHYFMAMAGGIHAPEVAARFREHASAEQAHADLIAARITSLGGEPDFNPVSFAGGGPSTCAEDPSLLSMVREDMVAEWIAIDSYAQMIRFVADRDPATRALLEKMLAAEEDQARDLAGLLVTLDPARKSD